MTTNNTQNTTQVDAEHLEAIFNKGVELYRLVDGHWNDESRFDSTTVRVVNINSENLIASLKEIFNEENALLFAGGRETVGFKSCSIKREADNEYSVAITYECEDGTIENDVWRLLPIKVYL